MPSERPALSEVASIYADEAGTLRVASALLPAAWLLATLFAAGLFASHAGGAVRGWAIVGLAGVLMQSVTFAAVEATRLAVAAASVNAVTVDGASVDSPSVETGDVDNVAVETAAAVGGFDGIAGLWTLHNALFGFNQVFLAIALLGFSMSGRGRMARWHLGAGFLGALLLFVSATVSPVGAGSAAHAGLADQAAHAGLADQATHAGLADWGGLAGLAGWLLWIVWIEAHSVTLLRAPRAA